MSSTPPSPSAHSRASSNSTASSSPLPVSIPGASASSPPPPAKSPQSPSSALSASLKAFSDLSLANKPPVNLESDEFKQAYHHARRASFGATKPTTRPIVIPDEGAAPRVVPGLSASPGSNQSDLSSLPTPSSSPSESSFLTNAPPPASINGGAASTALKRSSTSGSKGTAAIPMLGGVCEKDELAMERGELPLGSDVEPSSAPALPVHSREISSNTDTGLFSGGARWGWPGGSGAPGTHSPSGPDMAPLRRASLSFASPPSKLPSSSMASTSTSPAAVQDPLTRMQPLGRVVSAGAALQTSGADSGGGAAGGHEGFGIFRRFSIGGFTGKKKPHPPSPPSSFAHTVSPPPPAPQPHTPPVPLIHAKTLPSPSVNAPESRPRGRSLGAGSAAGTGAGKGKRKISPMGEKILRGGY
ncbi:hypothetical protein JCM1840_002421 [Sporobolomyces johnsonii]